MHVLVLKREKLQNCFPLWFNEPHLNLRQTVKVVAAVFVSKT